jgi:signal transduction histidine kinase/CheY-like chemotaxis protein
MLRVLSIEDSPDDLIARELRQQGFDLQFEQVENRDDFVAALDRQPWDIILSEFGLPGLSVRDAIAILRRRHIDAPFLVVSNAIGEQKAIDAMRAGAQDFIFKRSLGRLVPAIEREIEESANRRERRRAELFIGDLNRDLQRRVAELQTLFNLVPVGIAITETSDCRFIRANPAFERMLDVEPSSNISLSAPPGQRPSFRILIGGIEVAPDLLPIQRAARGEIVNGQEIAFVRSDGVTLKFLASAVPLLDEAGHPRGAVGAFADITEMKHAEVMLRNSERLASVGRLAATMAHEINNPLEAVTNVLYLLERTPGMPAYGTELVSIAQKEMQRIALIVKQTLGFHRESVSPTRLSVVELIDEVVSLYRRKLDSTGIHIDRDFRSRGEMEGYAGELRQVFANLLINAADAIGHSGNISIRVYDTTSRVWPERRRQPRPEDRPQRGVRVIIADNGPGIPIEHHRRLFEPFFTTKGEKGTGLGLWVSQGIVLKHGGKLQMRTSTRPGRTGTVFSIYLPAVAARPAEAKNPMAAGE